MCLIVIDEVPLSGVTEAYKVFIITESGLDGVYCYFDFKKRRWITDTNKAPVDAYTVENNQPVTYPPGFHCYMNKYFAIEKAARCNIRVCHRVLVRNIVASGFQQYSCSKESKAIVARQIYIMEEVYPLGGTINARN